MKSKPASLSPFSNGLHGIVLNLEDLGVGGCEESLDLFIEEFNLPQKIERVVGARYHVPSTRHLTGPSWLLPFTLFGSNELAVHDISTASSTSPSSNLTTTPYRRPILIQTLMSYQRNTPAESSEGASESNLPLPTRVSVCTPFGDHVHPVLLVSHNSHEKNWWIESFNS